MVLVTPYARFPMDVVARRRFPPAVAEVGRDGSSEKSGNSPSGIQLTRAHLRVLEVTSESPRRVRPSVRPSSTPAFPGNILTINGQLEARYPSPVRAV